MADWSLSSDPYKDSNQDSLGFGKSERLLFHIANWAMDHWTDWKFTQKFKISTARP